MRHCCKEQIASNASNIAPAGAESPLEPIAAMDGLTRIESGSPTD
jgi:hypothetical protein